jgi:hypothetical protein
MPYEAGARGFGGCIFIRRSLLSMLLSRGGGPLSKKSVTGGASLTGIDHRCMEIVIPGWTDVSQACGRIVTSLRVTRS